ncbi:MAG: helix-turn-helix domain-containing protein [Bacteroidales bacterium]
MGIFYMEEHKACSEYLTEVRLGFKYVEIDKGTVFGVNDKREKHLFFILEGRMKVCYNEFPNKEFGAGEMIFLPKSADCRGEALTKCSFIVHIYDAPLRLCDKTGLNAIINIKQNVQYEFKSLPICQTLYHYLLLLKMYISDGINCRYLHEIKQKELFMIFRTHYSKEDLAQFFYPMIGISLDFRSTVMEYYMDAKTAKQLAGYCGYSQIYFHNLFVAEFGEPPYKWMQRQKAKHIIGRLGQSNVSIKEIVDEFNFSSRCHFNKYCKSQYGDTAAKIRLNLLSVNR